MPENEIKNNNSEYGVPDGVLPRGMDGHYLLATRIVLIILVLVVLAMAVYGLYFYFSSQMGLGGQNKNLSSEKKLELLEQLRTTAGTSTVSTEEKLKLLENLSSGETESKTPSGGTGVTGSSNLTDQEMKEKVRLLELLKSQ